MPVYPGAPPHFCPPRLEVVVKEQNPNGFSSHPRDQSPFDTFLDHQTDGPAGSTFGRIAAHHSDDPLFLGIVEYGGCAGALLFEQRRFQTALLVTTRNRTDGLRSERNDLRDPQCAGAFGQLQQYQGAQDDSNAEHRHSAVWRVPSDLLARLRSSEAHTRVCAKTILQNSFYKNFRRPRDLV